MLKFLLLTSLLLSLLFPSHAQTSNYEQTIRLHGFVLGQTHDWSHESDISLPQPSTESPTPTPPTSVIPSNISIPWAITS